MRWVLVAAGLVAVILAIWSWQSPAPSKQPTAQRATSTSLASSTPSSGFSSSHSIDNRRDYQPSDHRSHDPKGPTDQVDLGHNAVPPSLESSPHTKVALEVTVTNTCKHDIELVWIDFDGDERSYGTLGTGVVRTLPTYLNHVWSLRGAGSQAELRRFAAQPGLSLEACAPTSPQYTNRPAPEPRDPPRTCSEKNGKAMDLLIENDCPDAVEVMWIDFDCSLRSYRRLAAGEKRRQPTFVGHAWRLVSVVTSGGGEQTLAEMIADVSHTELVACDRR